VKRLILWVVAIALAAYLLGLVLGAVLSGVPSDWLAVQEPTGRPPRLIGLLALMPIVIVGVVVLVIRALRRRKSRRSDADAASLKAPPRQ
jgi:MFS family permease